jgi:diguanylate cyclase (GGDEF)-like protein
MLKHSSDTHVVTIAPQSNIQYDSLEKRLELKLLEAGERLEKKGKDETGACRDDLFHRSLGYLVMEGIEFSEKGAVIKPGFENSCIVTLTGIDLQRVNSEHGHKIGDKYLKNTVEQAKGIVPEETVFHRGSQDFSCLTKVDDKKELSEKLKAMNFQIQNESYRTSWTTTSIREAVDIYNRFISEHTIQTNGQDISKIRTRIFTEIFVGISEYRRETNKFFDLGKEYLENENLTDIQRKNYNENVQYIFSGNRYGSLEGFKCRKDESIQDLRDDFRKTCQEIAGRNISGKVDSYDNRWRILIGLTVHPQEYLAEYFEETPSTYRNRPKMGFDEFCETHQTEKRRQLVKSKDDLEKARTIIENLLKEIDEQRNIHNMSDSITSLQNLGDVKSKASEKALDNALRITPVFETLITLINEQKNYFGGLDIQVAESLMKQGYNEPEKLAEQLGTKTKLQQIQQDLLRTKLAIKYAETQLSIELTEVDQTTGLSNKEAFEKRVAQIHADNTETYQLIMLDLGFVKYFNKEGNRKIGDVTIQTAGSVLEHVSEKYPGMIETFRTGGDEFALIVKGTDQDLIKGIVNAIKETSSEIGPVPSNRANLGSYLPERIQFDIGTCTKEEAEHTLQTLLQDKRSNFSEVDKEKLNRDGTEFDAEFYSETLGHIQVLRADLEISEQKLENRVKFFRKLMREGHTRGYSILFPYSGKSLHGLTEADLRKIFKENTETDDPTIVQLVKAEIASRGGLAKQKLDILEQVVVAYLKENEERISEIA